MSSELNFTADERLKIDDYIKKINMNIAQEKMTPVERFKIIEQFILANAEMMKKLVR